MEIEEAELCYHFSGGNRSCQLHTSGEQETQNEGIDRSSRSPGGSFDEGSKMALTHVG
jgi:hypothetical protein